MLTVSIRRCPAEHGHDHVRAVTPHDLDDIGEQLHVAVGGPVHPAEAEEAFVDAADLRGGRWHP